jgi:hypothetical protein
MMLHLSGKLDLSGERGDQRNWGSAAPEPEASVQDWLFKIGRKS